MALLPGLARAVVLAGCACLAAGVTAQYPTRPIKMVVMIAPGGGPDVSARLIAPKLSERLGQPVFVENRPGSNGNIAGQLVASAAPDGYTLLYAVDSLIAVNPHVYAKMPFDTLKDIVPVASTQASQVMIAVHPSVPVKNFREFVEYARRANPPLAFGSSGNASIHHLFMESVKRHAGIDLVHVPYKSGSPAVAAAIAGDIPVVVGGVSATPLVKAGKLRAIAASSSKRIAGLPEVPSISEFYPDVAFNIWFGIWAPAGTPDPVLTRLHTEINAVLSMKEIGERMIGTGGADPWITAREEFAAFIPREYERYGRIVRESRVKID